MCLFVLCMCAWRCIGVSSCCRFSTIAPILFVFDAPVAPAGLVSLANISASLDLARTTTLLVNAATGELHPHSVDVDAFDPSFGDGAVPPLLILNPASPMAHGARYIVAVRGLQYLASGAPVAPSAYFEELRRGPDTASDAARAAHFAKDVFPVLAGLGVDVASLQLAFDFVTVSRLSSLGRAEYMRDLALQAAGPGGGKFVIDRVTPEACGSGRASPRWVWGHALVRGACARCACCAARAEMWACV